MEQILWLDLLIEDYLAKERLWAQIYYDALLAWKQTFRLVQLVEDYLGKKWPQVDFYSFIVLILDETSRPRLIFED
jgi:hypothetical protein